MNKKLVDFISGQLAVQCNNASDMKSFVNWLKKYDIQELLVSNKLHEQDYYKISFWKEMAKSWHKGWIHPSRVKVIFVYYAGKGMDYYLFKEDLYKWWGEIDIVEAQEL